MPIFRVKSVKIYTGQNKFTRVCPWRPWQISGMVWCRSVLWCGLICFCSWKNKSSVFLESKCWTRYNSPGWCCCRRPACTAWSPPRWSRSREWFSSASQLCSSLTLPHLRNFFLNQTFLISCAVCFNVLRDWIQNKQRPMTIILMKNKRARMCS